MRCNCDMSYESKCNCPACAEEEVFQKELYEVSQALHSAVEKILDSEDRKNKHPPYTWRDEDEDEHLRKALRHILTYQIMRDGHQIPDGEDHLALAITRLGMARTR